MSNAIFNYQKAAERAEIPQDLFERIKQEAQAEFPFDDMMKELHIVRAINAYVSESKRAAS